MQLKRGRLIDHLHLRVRDLEASRKFYAALLDVLDIELVSTPDHFFADELWVEAGEVPSHVHFAFQAADHAMVDAWYAAGLKAGGRDNGPPGERKISPGLLRGLSARSRRAQCRSRLSRTRQALR